jgi:cytidylate kinase
VNSTSKSVVIAVDGTAASGKGTLAKKLASHFGFDYLDSGALYRLTALAVVQAGGDPRNETDALQGARSIDPSMAGDPAIRTDTIGQAASQVAAIAQVRQALLNFQRDFLIHPPSGRPGAVMDGRDIGTVICPAATAKLYIDARPELRAHRRWKELKDMGIYRDEAELLRELMLRDAADKARPISPLVQAGDAALLDTSDLGIEPAFAAALALVETKVLGALKDRHRG